MLKAYELQPWLDTHRSINYRLFVHLFHHIRVMQPYLFLTCNVPTLLFLRIPWTTLAILPNPQLQMKHYTFAVSAGQEVKKLICLLKWSVKTKWWLHTPRPHLNCAIASLSFIIQTILMLVTVLLGEKVNPNIV